MNVDNMQPKILELTESEIDTLKKLSHANILKYINHFKLVADSTNWLCLVTEVISNHQISNTILRNECQNDYGSNSLRNENFRLVNFRNSIRWFDNVKSLIFWTIKVADGSMLDLIKAQKGKYFDEFWLVDMLAQCFDAMAYVHQEVSIQAIGS